MVGLETEGYGKIKMTNSDPPPSPSYGINRLINFPIEIKRIGLIK